MKSAAMRRFLAVPALSMALTLHAQTDPPPAPRPGPPPPSQQQQQRPGDKGDRPPPPRGAGGGGSGGGERGDRDHDRDRDRDRDHGGDRGGGGDRGEWRGGMPGYGRPPMHSDSFDKLPEEEKKRFRAAFDKVWSRPEVIEARDRSMRANEELRDTIRATLAKIDPDVVAILDRVQPKDQFDPRQLPKLPPADSADFPRVLVQRLGMEMLVFSKPERREETRKFHERIILQPQVKEAISRLESTTGEERLLAMQKLREVYREAVGAEFRAARERREAEGKGGEKPGDRPGDAPGPPQPR